MWIKKLENVLGRSKINEVLYYTKDIIAMKKIFSSNLDETHISRELNSYIMAKDVTLQQIINGNYEFIIIIMV